MKFPRRFLVSLLALFASVLACASPASGGNPAPGVETIVAQTMDALTASAAQTNSTPAATNAPPNQADAQGLLPRTLYFLGNDNAGIAQVYRLETDGATIKQITFEPVAVTSYDVSLVDGSVAYVSNNQMVWINADGSNRRALTEAVPLDPNVAFQTRIMNPVFSPNGQTIAYGFQGLNFYSVTTGQSNRVLEDQIDNSNGFAIPREMYWPEQYSPDGSKLVITLGYYEGASAAVYYPNGNALVRLRGDEDATICCGEAQWSFDSSALYAASPTMGMFNAGLWRVDASNGSVTTLLAGTFETNPADLANEPFLAPDGQLYFFYASVPNTGDIITRAPLQLVRSAPDGVTNRSVLRPESFAAMNEALWAPDASFVIVANAAIPEIYQGGAAGLYYTDGQKAMIPLAPFVMEMKWGP